MAKFRIILVLLTLAALFIMPTHALAATTTIYADKDTELEQDDPTKNLGSSVTVGIGYYGVNEAYRSIVEFPIDWGITIPANATITSAVLSLYVYNTDVTEPGKTVYAQRLLRQDWVELQATWNIYKTGFSWTTGGAGSAASDYTATDQASATAPTVRNVWVDWDITAQVQWAQTNDKNVEIRLVGWEEGAIGQGLAFNSRNHGSNHPKLAITYTASEVLVPPTVTTQSATNVGGSSAMLHGTITDTGGATVTRRGFKFGLTQTNTWDTYETGTFGTGTYSRTASALTPGTTYWFRAYAANAYGTGYGTWLPFTTSGLPAVVTSNATYIGTSAARLNGQLTSSGGEACDVRFQYGYTSGVYSFQTSWVENKTTEEYFYADISGLMSDQTYYFRAQAKNTAGIISGNELSFHTGWELLPPNSFSAHATGGTTISLSWTPGGGSEHVAVQISTSGYPTSPTSGVRVYFGAESSTQVNNLTPGTSYYFRAWGEAGGFYSTNYTQDMATTLAGTPHTTPTEPTQPVNWFTTPDYTKMRNAPFYDQINALWDAYELPRNTGWTFGALFIAALLAMIALVWSRGIIWLALVVAGIAIVIATAMGIIPGLWPILFLVIIGGGYGYMKARAVG
jgi:hypothetical protein